MKRRLGILIMGACLAAAQAPEIRADDRLEAFYPEGPLVVPGAVLFAEMHKDRIVSWAKDGAHTFYESEGCGPTAIAPYEGGYAVLCHMKDEVHLISGTGELKTVLDKDEEGHPFDNPNDASADDHGGVYFSASGVFRHADQPKGALMYLGADRTIRRLDHDLYYANGVYFDARRRRLYVTEHLGPRTLVYAEMGPGLLAHRAVFKDFAEEKITPVDNFPLPGPDGLETDAEGNLYQAYYGAGTLFILSPEGKVLQRIGGQEPLITNVALADGGRTLVLTGSAFRPRKPFPGSVRRIPNPLHLN